MPTKKELQEEIDKKDELIVALMADVEILKVKDIVWLEGMQKLRKELQRIIFYILPV